MWAYNDELYHFGIKGMKWGVRRFQNKDGSLTSKGKKRYDDSDSTKKSNTTSRVNKLQKKYMEKGMNERQALVSAKKRVKTEKVIAGVAGLTVTAAATYLVSKEVIRRTDTMIKKGTKMQTIVGADPNRDFSNPFYTSFKKGDKEKYKGLFGNFVGAGVNDVHNVTLKADKNVKIASRKKAEDAFMELYKNDPEFRYNYKKTMSYFKDNELGMDKRNKVMKVAQKANLTEKELRTKGYDGFNIGLATHTKQSNSNAKKFYDKLKEKGYDAIDDVNDMKYSGYNSKKPVIVFNKSDKINVSDIRKMTVEEIDKAFSKESAKLRKYEKMKVNALATAYNTSTGALFAGSMLAGTKIANNSLVKQYKKEHPNTEMTDKEILKLLTKQHNKRK